MNSIRNFLVAFTLVLSANAMNAQTIVIDNYNTNYSFSIIANCNHDDCSLAGGAGVTVTGTVAPAISTTTPSSVTLTCPAGGSTVKGWSATDSGCFGTGAVTDGACFGGTPIPTSSWLCTPNINIAVWVSESLGEIY